MTDKEAIEYLKKRLSLLHRNYQFATEQAIETVLNLIQTQQKEIDLYNETEIAVNNRIMDLEAEIEKKDKIIDEMAIYLADIDFDECCAEIPEPCLSCSWEDYEPHTNCIKEYFINKVEKESGK